LLRIYLVACAGWVLFILFILPVLVHAGFVAEQQRETDNARRYREWAAEERQKPLLFDSNDKFAVAERLDHEKKIRSHEDAALEADAAAVRATQQMKSTETYAAYWRFSFFTRPLPMLALLIGPPAILYALAALIGWVSAGFRSARPGNS
jgi:hypothetical protein